MAGQHVVLCYDVEDDRRRARLQRRLKRYLVPVQKSVFEGPLRPRELERVVRLVERTVDLERDTVRIYLLCPACASSTLLLGTARPVLDDGDPRFP